MRYFSAMTACLIAACALLPARAAAEDWKFSASFNYDTGKYGTSDRTDSIYIPFTLKRYYGDADFSVTLPYLRQSSTGLVTRVGGATVRAGRKKAGSAAAATASSQSGPGDVLLRGGYALLDDGPRSPDLYLAGSLKLPTADKTKGLGTGKMDEGAGLELSKKVLPGLSLLADGYYTVIGKPAGSNYRDQLSFDAGFSSPLTGEVNLTALYETRNALVAGTPAPRDLSASLDYKSGDGNHYTCGLLLGLSDGSPQFGVNAGLSRRF